MTTKEARIVAATGLRFECQIAERSSQVTGIAGGGDARRFQQRLDVIARRGMTGIISFGIAGALDPALRSGDVIVGTQVACSEGWLTTDPAWTERICTALDDPKPARVLGSDEAISSTEAKQHGFETTGCRIVDMESHIAGRVALDLGLPFAVLRVVADDAVSDLPPAALVAMRPNGTTDLLAVLSSLARKPRQLPALIRLGAATGTARAQLAHCARRLGPGLGGIDLS